MYFHGEINMVPITILQQYAIESAQLSPLGTGLINATWLTALPNGQRFVLQRINTHIFRQPQHIDHNLQLLGRYFREQYPPYCFTQPIASLTGETMVQADGDCYRLFAFIDGSHTVDVVQTAAQAYEAAQQFGQFTYLLKDFDASKLAITLPDFHNLALRYQQFETSLLQAHPQRLQTAAAAIEKAKAYSHILHQYQQLLPHIKIRVTHHDTKISNVLFDAYDKGLCVIDLDTVMPGYFLSDVGDMLRTYLCPVSEEEANFDKVVVRPAFYQAIVQGYSDAMGDALNSVEKQQFLFAGKMMTYMQSLRFLTDYLNNDSYYGARYEGHNLIRAGNQLALLQQLFLLAE
jgi:Ser/Thr protein kinase RdoA (MazF antagonist)